MLVPSVGYNKNLIPPPIEDDNYSWIEYSTNIRETILIDEVKKIMRLKKQNVKEWFNAYLTFQNLNENDINLVHTEDRNNMWTPNYDSINAENEKMCLRTDETEILKAIPDPNKKHSWNSKTQHRNAFLFKVNMLLSFSCRVSTQNIHHFLFNFLKLFFEHQVSSLYEITKVGCVW